MPRRPFPASCCLLFVQHCLYLLHHRPLKSRPNNDLLYDNLGSGNTQVHRLALSSDEWFGGRERWLRRAPLRIYHPALRMHEKCVGMMACCSNKTIKTNRRGSGTPIARCLIRGVQKCISLSRENLLQSYFKSAFAKLGNSVLCFWLDPSSSNISVCQSWKTCFQVLNCMQGGANSRPWMDDVQKFTCMSVQCEVHGSNAITREMWELSWWLFLCPKRPENY